MEQGSHNVRVQFPCIHGAAQNRLISINCFPAQDLRCLVKVVAGVEEEVARSVVKASREGEPRRYAERGVMVIFSNPLFTGQSYRLALVVADKLARFNALQNWTEIYATGLTGKEKNGNVGSVEGFSEKLDLLLERAKQGSLFLYPASNLEGSSGVEYDKMEGLLRKDIECIGISHINDLRGSVYADPYPFKEQGSFRPFSFFRHIRNIFNQA